MRFVVFLTCDVGGSGVHLAGKNICERSSWSALRKDLQTDFLPTEDYFQNNQVGLRMSFDKEHVE